jgi:DNA-binding response OmpR family regulator
MDEIKIHRRKRVVYVNGSPVKLSKDEYELMTTLGIMGNHLVPTDILMDVMCEGQTQIPADKTVLQGKMWRLRKKMATDVLKNSRDLGYVLQGDVQFIG